MTVPGKGGAPKNKPKSAAHKAKISKAQEGKKNSNYDKGQRLPYREIAGAKEGDITHHRNGDHTDNRPSNLQNLSGRKPGARTNSKHEKITDRKGKKKT